MLRQLYRLVSNDNAMNYLSAIKKQDTRETRRRKTGGFTIVETLVAVAILMIAIAGPLVVATKGLNSALVSKDQMIASYLAQESMEAIKNKKDNNLNQYPGDLAHWLDGIYTAGSACDSDANGCDTYGIDSNFGLVCGSSCQLYYDNQEGYNRNGIGPATIFYRHFYLENKNANGKTEMLVHVIVDWKEGTIPYQIHLTSQMTPETR